MPFGEDDAGVDDLGVPVSCVSFCRFVDGGVGGVMGWHTGQHCMLDILSSTTRSVPEHVHRAFPAHVHPAMSTVVHASAVIHAFIKVVHSGDSGGSW